MQIILRRQAVTSSNHGFGFTLHGRSPAVVGQVLDGSAADKAGLRQGDLVERVNGRNVSRSAANRVADIVRLECVLTKRGLQENNYSHSNIEQFSFAFVSQLIWT